MNTTIQPPSRIGRTPSERYAEIIGRYLGPAISAFFADDDVTEVYVNPQEGVVRIHTRSRGKVTTDERMPGRRVEMLLNAVAESVGENLTPANPRLQAELPNSFFRGSRLQGIVAPISAGPTFTIRKPPSVIYSLDDYLTSGTLRGVQR